MWLANKLHATYVYREDSTKSAITSIKCMAAENIVERSAFASYQQAKCDKHAIYIYIYRYVAKHKSYVYDVVVPQATACYV